MRKSLPKVDRRVGSPRFHGFQINIGVKLERPLENQIRPGKRVRVADGSKADILSRPGTDALGLKKRVAKQHRILSFRERNSSAQHATAELPNRLSASPGCFDFNEVGLRQDIGTRKQMGSPSRYRVSDLGAVAKHQLTDETASLFGRDQLAQN